MGDMHRPSQNVKVTAAAHNVDKKYKNILSAELAVACLASLFYTESKLLFC